MRGPSMPSDAERERSRVQHEKDGGGRAFPSSSVQSESGLTRTQYAAVHIFAAMVAADAVRETHVQNGPTPYEHLRRAAIAEARDLLKECRQ